ncbi:DUF2523 family protein [Vibrio sp. THAF190c]|uniref:DUF2523 family protein n=1 Tax=Vibrio sp. THAF190c TaxID=2587865 RepID=UPI001267B819|nr:DUF2523 family protein [Vibrio sp. THAF190c]QFT09735.1 hypothetical protein FIV04_07115 [Vibrio sp. THAF190c]QFT09743.1 hypothetical protein FIV04_07155 [Vibrio sp. THAF190c]QFT09751.1 hypothetical protein FIV04_07195 [Vibrio sp. THAF190c]
MWTSILNALWFIASFLFGWLFTWIGRALPWIAGFFGSTVTQIALSFGFGVTTFTGFNMFTSRLLEFAASGMDGVPAAVPQLLGLMWVDKALNLMLSSAFVLMTIKGLKAGKFSRSVWSAPGSKTGGFGA